MTEVEKALQALKVSYLGLVPNGYSRTYFNLSFGIGSLAIGLIAEERDCPSRIRENDKGHGKFGVRFENDEYVIVKHFHMLTVNPKIKHHALGYEKVSFRKIKAKDIESLVAKFEKYISRFLEMARKEIAENNIYNQKDVKEIYLTF